MREERPFKPSVLDKLIGGMSRIRGDGSRDVAPCYIAPLDNFTERELKKVVIRDISWIMNDIQFSAAIDLADYPEVTTSVLNQGVSDLTSMLLARASLDRRARDLADSIRAFETRLSPGTVKVTFDTSDVANENKVRFTIHGELKGAIDDRFVELKTAVALDSGEVEVTS
ncbi:GPW/gp25 family protein [Sandarakinorhabdus sp.]|uniref:type VI secretion system baseplate subunit TssE n=1 Tax=Sandarakinorhabdus sp. TaxID=1916663 RepID=UPI00286E93C1|nr:GPW/gp25 family protein [Sandarakinorhabdus sp.]